jgi:hypothetical protein
VPGEAGNLFFTGGPQGVPTHPAGEPFYQSTDGGVTWTAIPNVLEVTTFGFGAPVTPGGYPSVYIVGYVNNVYGIWQSNDDAKSWTQIGDYPAGSLDQIRTIAGDPNIYGQVYVGFQGSGYAYLPAAGTDPQPVSISNGTPITSESGGLSSQTPMLTSSVSGQTAASIGSTNTSRSSLSSTAQPMPDSEFARNRQRHADTTKMISTPIESGRSERSSLFGDSPIAGTLDAPASPRDSVHQKIALLSQYTVAGFHHRGNECALGIHITPANASDGFQMLLPSQVAQERGRNTA